MSDDQSAKSTDQLLADRRRKFERLRDEFHRDPYGQRTPGIVPLAEAASRYDQAADDAHKAAPPPEAVQPSVDSRPVVTVAGRVMQHRVMGNLVFMLLRDHTGDLQIAVSKKSVGPEAFTLASKLTDYGDIVSATGPLARTKTGEVTVWAKAREREQGTGNREQANQSNALHADAEEGSFRGATETSGIPAPPYQILTKSLALPPGKHHGLTDPETRYRKRYVDLYSNPDVMRTMRLRIQIIDEIRDYLRGKGFLEVETPMLQSLHGGAAARPFKTHHNALDIPLSLRIAPELYLKRLLVGGMTKVFEINRNFRNEGISPRHNPEFTMLEAYEAYGNWETMAELVEDMVCTVAMNVFGTLTITSNPGKASRNFWTLHLERGVDEKGNPLKEETRNWMEEWASTSTMQTINLKRPWRRVSMVDLVAEKTDFLGCRWNFDKRSAEKCVDPSFFVWMEIASVSPGFAIKLATNLIEKGIKPDQFIRNNTELAFNPRRTVKFRSEFIKRSPAEQLVEVYEKLIEPTLLDPTFVTRVPSVVIPLAKKCADDDFFADVYELAINGVEISPGYTELNDPEVQETNFRGQVGDKNEQQQVDEDFLEALRVGMPPAGGMGLGIDRLVMMLTGAESIRDVILFPLMRPVGITE